MKNLFRRFREHRHWDGRKDDLRGELESHLRLAIAARVDRGESPRLARAV